MHFTGAQGDHCRIYAAYGRRIDKLCRQKLSKRTGWEIAGVYVIRSASSEPLTTGSGSCPRACAWSGTAAAGSLTAPTARAAAASATATSSRACGVPAARRATLALAWQWRAREFVVRPETGFEERRHVYKGRSNREAARNASARSWCPLCSKQRAALLPPLAGIDNAPQHAEQLCSHMHVRPSRCTFSRMYIVTRTLCTFVQDAAGHPAAIAASLANPPQLQHAVSSALCMSFCTCEQQPAARHFTSRAHAAHETGRVL